VSDRHNDILVYSDAITSFELLTPDFKRPPEKPGINYGKEDTKIELRLKLLHFGKMELSFYCPHYRFYIPKDIKQVYVEKGGDKIHALYVPQLGGVGKLVMGPDKKWTAKWQLDQMRKRMPSEKVFGKAIIKLGMTKAEVLKQIELSRSQYNTLESEKSTELYIEQSEAETISKDEWILNCPSRNSRFLGGGSGIRLHLVFEKNKLKVIEILPWMCG